MWQSPNQRVRAIANSKRRERERMSSRLHIRRVAVVVRLNEEDIPARAVLNDLSPSGIGLFSTQQLTAGQEIQISIKAPKPLQVRGTVISCQEYDSGSHILAEHTYTHRIGVQFVFDSPEQEKEVQAYCNAIAGDLHNAKAAA